jgi:hypothetical protein
MTTYRLYKLDEAGKFNVSEQFEAADDSEAMTLARAREHPFMCEVWLARRLVGRFSPFML